MIEAPVLASDPVLQALCPLAFHMRRGGASVVGRTAELDAINTELAAARNGLSAITLEGEPGIGKTRLLLAATDMATREGFIPVAVAADEELRGPFLLMRSVLSALRVNEDLPGTPAEEVLERAMVALSGRSDSSLESLPSDQKLLRQFDLAALALRAVARVQPLALFADDIQWADEDSLRALRYAVRTDTDSPIFLLLAFRPEETAQMTEAVNLVADMERMGLIRRERVDRFTQVETAAFLRQHLGGQVDLVSAATIHAQSEGVPFILEELAHAYRDAGMIQQIDGVWSVAKNADRLAPSAVQTLIQRRSNRLPEETKTTLGEAAVLGRSFSLRDLYAVKVRLGDQESEADPVRLADVLGPAVIAGLMNQHQAESAADYSFTHEQVRQFAMSSLSQPRRRAIHAAIVEMLTEGVEPSVESLPVLALHAAAAGDVERTARFSLSAARAAMNAHAPEEALRAVEVALPLASGPKERVLLLSTRDDALAMLRRPNDRLEGLAELGALADALGDPHLELEVMLRRAASLRLAEEGDRAADLAERVRKLADERGDRRAELAAALELGQAVIGLELGEGFVPAAAEVDLDRAQEAFERAAALAEELGDETALAAALRELGCIQTGRVRAWFVDEIKAGNQLTLLARATGGESLSDILNTLPILPNAKSAQALLERATDLFEKVGDRRGMMSSVIALAYLRFGPDIHMGSNAAQRIEEIRRLTTRLRSLTMESERAATDAQMAYGVHVFARAKVIPDLAVSRGEEAYWASKTIGDRSLEFLAAGGTALALLDLGDVAEAERWLGLAGQAATAAPTPLRARRLEFWRGLARAAAGDAGGMREHFERALKAATEQGRAAGRCEVLARMALEAARLGSLQRDDGLLSAAEGWAAEAKELVQYFVAHQPWGAQADAALAEVALARGDVEAAGRAGMAAWEAVGEAMREDIYPELLLPTARAVLAGGPDEAKTTVRHLLQLLLALTAVRTSDEEIRARWFRGPVGREWSLLAGPIAEVTDLAGAGGALAGSLAEDERRLLRLLTEGLTVPEMAEQVGATEESVRSTLAKMFAVIGASSRGEATTFALVEGVL